jgi:hypothetical protein
MMQSTTQQQKSWMTLDEDFSNGWNVLEVVYTIISIVAKNGGIG